MIDLSIIILSYNTRDLLKQCLSSVFSYLPDHAEVIVVDNASTDNSADMVAKDFLKALLIRNAKNVGFGAGINLAAEKAKGKYLLLLNSDTVLKDDSLEKLLTFVVSKDRVGVVGGMFVNSDGSMQRSFGSFYTLPAVTRMLIAGDKAELSGHDLDEPKEVDWVGGGFMLIPKEIFDTINGFDEHFFMYIEDMELCFRVKQRGYAIYVFPKATAVHVGQGSSNRAFAIEHIYKGLRYFYKKHRQPWEYAIVNSLLIGKAALLIGLGTITQNSYLRKTYLRALKA